MILKVKEIVEIILLSKQCLRLDLKNNKIKYIVFVEFNIQNSELKE